MNDMHKNLNRVKAQFPCSVKVKFLNGKSFSYNSKYYLKVNDVVYVDGKLAGELGTVISVEGDWSHGSYMREVTEAYRIGPLDEPEILQEFSLESDWYGNLKISKYLGSKSTIAIPESFAGKPITTIAASAFEGNRDLKEIKLSSNITKLEEKAFKDCINLKSVDFSVNLTKIEDRAFENCESLKEVELVFDSEKTSSIGSHVFLNCVNLLITK
jgi:hypothetical protein